ncbi:MAG: carboxymuconolactone decarboxylase family protein [Candidatus Acidiferrales bacterium]
MSYVQELEPTHADIDVRELYGKIENRLGFLPRYFKALGAKPRVIEAQLALNDAILEDGALPMTLKEQIGLVVSGINTSSYCIWFHMELLRRFGIEKAVSRKLCTDYQNAPVDAKTQALFRFADKLTRNTLDFEESDVQAVRDAGWGDDEIRETILTVAYFNYINRVSLGLGVVEDF